MTVSPTPREMAERLMELHAKATPGPVIVERHDSDDGSINFEVWSQRPYERHFTIYEHLDAKRGKANADLYAAAHNDTPAICAALLASQERVRELEAIARGFLDCPEIADCAPVDKDPETDDLERRARRALKENTNG